MKRKLRRKVKAPPTTKRPPAVSAAIMELHHGKHHRAYVTNLNAAIEKAQTVANRAMQEPRVASAYAATQKGAQRMSDYVSALRPLRASENQI